MLGLLRWLALGGMLLGPLLGWTQEEPPSHGPRLVANYLNAHAQVLQLYHLPLENLALQVGQGEEHLTLALPDWKAAVPAYRPLVQQVQSEEELFFESDSAGWLPSLRQYLALAQSFEETCRLLASHVQKEKYHEDESAYLLAALQRLAVMLEDARTLQREIRFWLSRTPSAGAEAVAASRAVQALAPLLDEARGLLLCIRQGQAAGMRQRRSRLAGKLLRLETQAETWLDQLPSRPGSSADPRKQWRKVLALTQAWLKLSESCLGDAVPPPYDHWGKGYHCFNHRLNPGFSGPGQGLVAAYNRLVQLSGAMSLPPEVGELPWLQVLPPPTTTLSAIGTEATYPSDTAPSTLSGAKHQNLVFLVDVSSSMQQPGRLPLFREAVNALIEALRPTDYVAMVLFAGKARTILPPTSGEHKTRFREALNQLQGQGRTAIHPGFSAAYRAAQQNLQPEGNNRLILVTDGEFDINEELLGLIEAQGYAGVTLTVLLAGEASPRMQYRMRRMAEVGQGHLGQLSPHRATTQLIQEVRKD